MRRTAVLLAAAVTPGCYTWREIPREALVPGVDIRATLDRETALARLGESGAELRMTVSGTATDQIHGDVLGYTARTRGSAFNTFQSVPWSGVVRLEEKRFSWTRTGGLAALGIGATVAILSVIEGQTDEGGEGPGPNEAPVARIPLFTIAR